MAIGFKDLRNPVELLLAPGRPASRTLARFGTLKLGLGTNLPVPGAIASAADVTSSLRHAFKGVLELKRISQSISATLASTLSAFDPAKLTGLPVTGKVSVSSSGIPSPASFIEFSVLPAGKPIPKSFLNIIEERKQQLQALTSRIATVFTGNIFGGVSILENFKKTPYPLDSEIDVPTIPRLAQGGPAAQLDDILKDKRKFTITGVQIGSGKPSFWSRLVTTAALQAVPSLNPVVNQIFKDRTNQGAWSEPPSPYAAQFPYNKVQQTESGHVIELDDTPGAERVHLFHRAGSFIEFHPNGTVVYKNMRDGYDLTMGNKYVKVNGDCHISVDGRATLYVKGNVDVQSDGDISFNAKKDFNVYAQNINLRAKRTFRADGTQINLRYINLPTSLVPVAMGGGFAPRVSISALKFDFPNTNIDTVLRNMAANPLDPRAANDFLSLQRDPLPEPIENPLSNPGIYTVKNRAAAAYRARLFDTPEETENFELYTAHVSLQRELGDYTGDDPRRLGGRLIAPEGLDSSTSTPTIDYLNYDDFKGRFEYDDNFSLGGTSFVLSDLVDTALYPSIVPKRQIPVPPLAPEEPVVEVVAPNIGGGGGSDSGSGGGGGGGGRPGVGRGEEIIIPENVQYRLDVVQAVNRDYPGLITSNPAAFVDQVAHRLNRLDGFSGSNIRWGRKAAMSDGSGTDSRTLAYRNDMADAAKKTLINIISSKNEPMWLPIIGNNIGDGYWTPPKSADRD